MTVGHEPPRESAVAAARSPKKRGSLVSVSKFVMPDFSK